MGRDSKGVDRGRCSKPGCNCVQFSYKKENGPKCSNCGHVPVSHALIKPFNDPSGFASEKESDEETVEVTLKHPSENNVDIRGTTRGECTNPGCNCRQFSCIKTQGPKCSVCGHTPVRHTEIKTSGRTFHKDEDDDEFAKDSALFKPRNKMPSTPSKMLSSIRISSPQSLPNLHIIDMEEDPMDSYNPSLPVYSSKQVPLLDGYSLQSGMPKRPKTQSAIDRSMVPVFPTDGHQLGSMPPVQTNPPYQGSSSSISQQSQSFASMPPSIPAPTAAHVQHTPTAPQVIPRSSVQQQPVQKTCKVAGCNKPVHVEANGRVHDFCGRRHAAEFNSAGVPPHLKCSNPSCKRMKFRQENGVYFDYCGKSCRDSYRKLQEPQILPGNTCTFPGCKKAKYFDSKSNSYLDYCGQTHANEAKKQLIRKANKQEFERIKSHFTNWWDPRKGNCGQVYEVLVIENSKLKDQFTKYHSSLSVKTVKQYYHGTSLKCAIYQSTTVCSDTGCGICGVSQKGMQHNYKTSNITFQRFGDGFYLAPNSSKCHDYTRGHDKYRAMLLFDVAEGNKYVVKDDQTKLKAPPTGYDSVYGQRGSSLNYDEIVLYKSEALLPTHIVVYMKDGTHKIAK